jgi:hypothetical protein
MLSLASRLAQLFKDLGLYPPLAEQMGETSYASFGQPGSGRGVDQNQDPVSTGRHKGDF